MPRCAYSPTMKSKVWRAIEVAGTREESTRSTSTSTRTLSRLFKLRWPYPSSARNKLARASARKPLGGTSMRFAMPPSPNGTRRSRRSPFRVKRLRRGGILDYNSKGYVTLADERSGSRTVEYAYDDFAIAEVACGLNHPAEARLFAARSGNWQNLWDRDRAAEDFKGFLRPRNPDGTWAEPNRLVRGTWPDFFYEGDLWTYSFYAPHDVRRLIELSGGN